MLGDGIYDLSRHCSQLVTRALQDEMETMMLSSTSFAGDGVTSLHQPFNALNALPMKVHFWLKSICAVQ
jgi:hypothetical protein